MKNLTTLFCVAAASLLLSLSDSSAGTITITSGPSFTPGNVVTGTPTIIGSGTQLVKIVGNSTITQPNPVVSTVTLDISGTFTVNTGEFASYAYNFNIALNSNTPATFTLTATANLTNPIVFALPPLSSGPQTIAANSNANYRGSQAGTLLSPFTGSGTFSAQLKFDFGAGTLPGSTLVLTIPNNSIDFQVATTAIPEPSTYVLLGLGLGGLLFRSRRRATA